MVTCPQGRRELEIHSTGEGRAVYDTQAVRCDIVVGQGTAGCPQTPGAPQGPADNSYTDSQPLGPRDSSLLSCFCLFVSGFHFVLNRALLCSPGYPGAILQPLKYWDGSLDTTKTEGFYLFAVLLKQDLFCFPYHLGNL